MSDESAEQQSRLSASASQQQSHVVELLEAAALEAELEAELSAYLELLEDDAPESETSHPSAEEPFEISDADDSDEPAQKIATGGATADPVKDYVRLISKIALLNEEQEVTLAKRIEAGIFADEALATKANLSPRDRADLQYIAAEGRRAKAQLLEANLRLVVSLARRHTGRGMAFLDLIQEGNLGLIRAVEKFDYTMGFKFSTYATWWIRQAITRAMADQARTIRIPVHMVEVIEKIARAKRQQRDALGREPSLEELALQVDMNVEKVAEIMKYDRALISLETPLGDEDDLWIHEDGAAVLGQLIEDADELSAEEILFLKSQKEALDAVLSTLPDREAMIVRMRFGLDDGEPKTLDDIGRTLGVTRERIRQIENKTLSKLRNPSRAAVLFEFLN